MRTNPADEKNKFFEAACRDEYNYYVKNMHTKPTSEAISFPSGWFGPKSTRKPSISYANDSVYEMFCLMSQGKRVAANTAANGKCIGGGFTTMWKYRKGKGSQEEGVMALLSGHLTSLLQFAQRDSKGRLLRIDNDSNQGRFNYIKNTLARNIILSKNLHTRIRMDLLDDYKRDRRGCKFFADYVAYRYSLDKSVLSHDTSYTIDIYSIAALDRRGLSRSITITRYNQLGTDTYDQISTMLKSAKSRNIYSVVITVPGSGVFSNIGYNSNAKKDTTYLDTVEEAVIAAIEKHGYGLEEIIICGLR
ncbi:hypothetical protein THOM_1977 [Trachipleistophora hominis]|uniref:Uncharacterized protein n=1 Tax=Trachipleistophora hominis TaxID=72359 RepID=L7JVL1_TRAHO|nr:hypothetical protein THOM_1977 [Trachipleistophora hominis]